VVTSLVYVYYLCNMRPYTVAFTSVLYTDLIRLSEENLRVLFAETLGAVYGEGGDEDLAALKAVDIGSKVQYHRMRRMEACPTVYTAVFLVITLEQWRALTSAPCCEMAPELSICVPLCLSR
jgi:hypothetical protein